MSQECERTFNCPGQILKLNYFVFQGHHVTLIDTSCLRIGKLSGGQRSPSSKNENFLGNFNFRFQIIETQDSLVRKGP